MFVCHINVVLPLSYIVISCRQANNVFRMFSVHVFILLSKDISFYQSDGARKSGLFVLASYVLEKLKLEQEIDVFDATRHIQINRPQFLASEVKVTPLCVSVCVCVCVCVCVSVCMSACVSVLVVGIYQLSGVSIYVRINVDSFWHLRLNANEILVASTLGSCRYMCAVCQYVCDCVGVRQSKQSLQAYEERHIYQHLHMHMCGRVIFPCVSFKDEKTP